jgi:hypothetical protein
VIRTASRTLVWCTWPLVIVVVGMLGSTGCTFCYRAPDHPLLDSNSPARPFCADVQILSELPTREAVSEALRIIRDLGDSYERAEFGVPRRCIYDFALELLVQERSALLWASYMRVPEPTQSSILNALMDGNTVPARRLLGELSIYFPENIRLAGYREEGIEFLLQVVESPGRHVIDRIRAAQELGRHAPASAIQRLSALAGDKSRADGPVGGAIAAENSVGENVRRSIELIQRRASEQERGSGQYGPDEVAR